MVAQGTKRFTAYTIAQAAARLGVTTTTVYNYLAAGKLARYNDVAGRINLVTAESVERLLAAQEAQAR